VATKATRSQLAGHLLFDDFVQLGRLSFWAVHRTPAEPG
jgi:hypothetical protein